MKFIAVALLLVGIAFASSIYIEEEIESSSTFGVSKSLLNIGQNHGALAKIPNNGTAFIQTGAAARVHAAANSVSLFHAQNTNKITFSISVVILDNSIFSTWSFRINSKFCRIESLALRSNWKVQTNFDRIGNVWFDDYRKSKIRF